MYKVISKKTLIFFFITLMINSILVFQTRANLKSITVQSRLDLRGLENIRIPMTPSDAEKASNLTLVNDGNRQDESCYYLSPKNNKELQISFMVQKGLIVRIDVKRNSPIKTLSGIGTGSSESKVKQVYGKNITQREHPYHGNAGNYLIFTPVDKADSDYQIIFETYQGKVITYRTGLKNAVRLIEGCS